jgi:hypothetical protein
MVLGAGSPSPSGAGKPYSNSTGISPSISPAAATGAASTLPILGGFLSMVAGICGVLAFVLWWIWFLLAQSTWVIDIEYYLEGFAFILHTPLPLPFLAFVGDDEVEI